MPNLCRFFPFTYKKHNNHILKAESLWEQSWELITWKTVLMRLGWGKSYAAAIPVNAESTKPAHFLVGQKRCSGDVNSTNFKLEPDYSGLQSIPLLLNDYCIISLFMRSQFYFQLLYVVTFDNLLNASFMSCLALWVQHMQKQISAFPSVMCFSSLAPYRLWLCLSLNACTSFIAVPTHCDGFVL